MGVAISMLRQAGAQIRDFWLVPTHLEETRAEPLYVGYGLADGWQAPKTELQTDPDEATGHTATVA